MFFLRKKDEAESLRKTRHLQFSQQSKSEERTAQNGILEIGRPSSSSTEQSTQQYMHVSNLRLRKEPLTRVGGNGLGIVPVLASKSGKTRNSWGHWAKVLPQE